VDEKEEIVMKKRFDNKQRSARDTIYNDYSKVAVELMRF
jgi:hypothetical protein